MAHHGGDGDGGIPPPGANFVAIQHADIVALAKDSYSKRIGIDFGQNC